MVQSKHYYYLDAEQVCHFWLAVLAVDIMHGID